MTCSRDTIINIWDLKGERLGTVDTKMMNNSFASISPCGRFFGACGTKINNFDYRKTCIFANIFIQVIFPYIITF